MADPLTTTLIVTSVVGTAQQIRVSNAQTRINDWQAEEQARVANVKFEQRQVERLEKVRKVLAQNNVRAAVSGVALDSESIIDLKQDSIENFELDQLTDRANTESYVNNLAAAAQASRSVAQSRNFSSVLQTVGTVANLSKKKGSRKPATELGDD